MRSKQEYARQRFGAGIVVGGLAQLVLAFLLGLALLSASGFGVRMTAGLVSCLIATPALLSVGFAIMLKDDARSFGGGILVGAAAATLLWVLLAIVF